MSRELPVDRAIYLVDSKNRSYRFLRRNPDWQTLDKVRNSHNKKQLDGFTRIFKDGRKRIFRYPNP